MKRVIVFFMLAFLMQSTYAQTDPQTQSLAITILDRNKCCLFSINSFPGIVMDISIYDKEGKKCGEGKEPGSYLVPYYGTLKVDWDRSQGYNRVYNKSQTFHVGTAYELSIYFDSTTNTIMFNNPTR